MRKHFEGLLDSEDIKPYIEKGAIWFPVNVAYEYIDADGRSFGYPVDDGNVTTVEYSDVRGVLAEDTIELFNVVRELRMSIKTPRYDDVFIHADDCQDELKDFVGADNYKQIISDDVGYHEWSHDARMAYNDFFNKRRDEVVEHGDLLIEFSGAQRSKAYALIKYRNKLYINTTDQEGAPALFCVAADKEMGLESDEEAFDVLNETLLAFYSGHAELKSINKEIAKNLKQLAAIAAKESK